MAAICSIAVVDISCPRLPMAVVMNKKTLLPIGFEDWIAPQAGQAHQLLYQIVDCFQSYDYALVAPPVIEFEESLLSTPDAPKAQDMFRFIDPISHHTIALRADITPQITRLAQDHLAAQSRPLRLCYYGHVFRIAGSNLRPHRQYMQMGIEHIGGADHPPHDSQPCIEVLRIALEALIEAGIEHLCLDFTLPVLLRDTIAGLSEQAQQLVSARNIGGLESMMRQGTLSTAIGEQLSFAMTLPPDPLISIEKLQKNKYFADKYFLISQLYFICQQLSVSHPQVQLSLDIVEQRHFNDKTGIAYNIYASGVNAVLGRGGEYYADQEKAHGVSIYLDSILALKQAQMTDATKHTAPQESTLKRLAVPLDTDFSLTRGWRQAGWQVLFTDHRPSQCDHYWDGNSIQQYKNKYYT